MIVQYTGDKPPKFDGVILIDCWHPQEKEANKHIFFYQLSNYLNSIQDDLIQVINASMKLKLDYQDRSITNTLQRYCWDYEFDRDDPNTPNYYNTWILFNSLMQFLGDYTVFSGLKKTILDSSTSFYIVTLEDFLSHWHGQGRRRATEWLVVGQSWRNCVHNNSMGLLAFSELIEHHNMNFYVDEKYILNDNDQNLTETDFSNDALHWMKYHDTTVYKLMSTK
jgi:hypothetical protein